MALTASGAHRNTDVPNLEENWWLWINWECVSVFDTVTS